MSQSTRTDRQAEATNTPLASIQYHPYVALTAYFDHSRVIRQSPPCTSAQPNSTDSAAEQSPDEWIRFREKSFQEACGDLRLEIHTAAAQFPCSYAAEEIQDYLFAPQCWSALGHSDGWGVVLLDNLMSATRLTAAEPGTEESDLAFCPILREVPPASQPTAPPAELSSVSPWWPFEEPEDIFTPTARGKLPPLCVTTHFKCNLLATLPNALALQAAIYTTLVETVRRTLFGLLAARKSNSEIPQDLLTLEDIAGVRCLLLEPLGNDDITLTCYTSNYTVAHTVLAVTRSLTLNDVFECHPDVVKDCLERSEFHQRLASNSKAARKKRDLLKVFGGNHLFMRTYSTLGFDYRLLSQALPGVNGACEAMWYFDVCPGHDGDVRKQLKRALRLAKKQANQLQESPEHQPLLLRSEDANWIAKHTFSVLPGTHDQAHELSSSRSSHSRQLISTRFFFEVLRQLLFLRAHWESRERKKQTRESGFLDITSSLRIATPSIDKQGPFAVASRFLPSESLPRRVEWKNHGFGSDFYTHLADSVRREWGLVSILEFHKRLREMGCPPSLQYSLLYIVQEFLECLGDPFRCDAVLDLYDPIDTLLHSLHPDGVVMNFHRRQLNSWSHRWRLAKLFSEESLRQYIDAIRTALTWRVQRVTYGHECRDIAFTLRFGVGKLMAAMDSPLKCCMAAFRRSYSGTDSPDEATVRKRFSGVVSIDHRPVTDAEVGVTPSASDPQNDIAAESRLAILAVRLDVFDLLRPEQAYYIIHEAAHLFVAAQKAWISPVPPLSLDDDESFDGESRTEEILADLISAIFIFRNDALTFARFHSLMFSESSGQIIQVEDGADEQSYQIAMLEVMLRGFIVSELLKRIPAATTELPLDWLADTAALSRGPDEVFKAFMAHAAEVGHCFVGLTQFWNESDTTPIGTALRRHCRELATGLCTDAFRGSLQKLVNVAAHSWKLHWSRENLAWASTSNGEQLLESLRAAFTQCVEHGKGFMRTGWERASTIDARNQGLDSLIVVCGILGEYIRQLVNHVDTHATVFVDANLEPTGKTYSRLLMDSSHVAFRACHPKMRQQKLLAQIAYFKTMGDIAAQIRARRLLQLSHGCLRQL